MERKNEHQVREIPAFRDIFMGKHRPFHGMACKEDWRFLDEPRLDDIADAVLDNDPDRLLALLHDVFGDDTLRDSTTDAGKDSKDTDRSVSSRSSDAA